MNPAGSILNFVSNKIAIFGIPRPIAPIDVVQGFREAFKKTIYQTLDIVQISEKPQGWYGHCFIFDNLERFHFHIVYSSSVTFARDKTVLLIFSLRLY